MRIIVGLGYLVLLLMVSIACGDSSPYSGEGEGDGEGEISEGEGEAEAQPSEGEGEEPQTIDFWVDTQEACDALEGVTYADSITILGSVRDLSPLDSFIHISQLNIVSPDDLEIVTGFAGLETVVGLSISSPRIATVDLPNLRQVFDIGITSNFCAYAGVI